MTDNVLKHQRLNVAIAFFIFNRPNTTKKVFEVIRQVKPPKLFVIADGCRENNLSDQKNCFLVRSIIETVDWDCEVIKKYSEVNLGLDKNIVTGLNCVFESVDRAIILEDDCLPHPSFFYFCQELLERYKNNHRITKISGINRQDSWNFAQQSYHFCLYGSFWGWATWKRAWNLYSNYRQLLGDQEVQQNIANLIDNEVQLNYIQKTSQIDNWDYQWNFVQLAYNGLSIIPALNLVKNIGFSGQATHTKGISILKINNAYLDLFDIKFPLKHPVSMEIDRIYDKKHFSWDVYDLDSDTMIELIEKLIAKKLYMYALLMTKKAMSDFSDCSKFKEYHQKLIKDSNI